MDMQGFFSTISGLQKQSRIDETLAILRDVLCRGDLPPVGIDKAGRVIRNLRAGQAGDPIPLDRPSSPKHPRI